MPPTIEQVLRQATHQLAATSPSPRLDTEVLFLHITGYTRATLITHAQNTFPPELEEKLNDLICRRARGEPIAYLVGKREFWSMELKVTPDVLIPRPETELLVEQVLQLVPLDAAWTIADLGTGSGALALAIAKERPRCGLIATDSSQAALAVAISNARYHGLANIEFFQGDWLTPVAGVIFDIIVSNPPYVRIDDPHLVNGDVRFEPRLALVAGPLGLTAIQTIIVSAGDSLKPNGWLYLEHGYDQAATVRSLLDKHGYNAIASYRDLAGHERITAGRWPH